MSQVDDDKVPICMSFILERLAARPMPRPLVIGFNGMQGVGKTTLVAALAAALDADGIPNSTCSIDDFYLTHEGQRALASEHPDNALVQHRGEPGGLQSQLYDKGAFNGQGDRRPEQEWKPAGQPGQPPPQVVLFEGWLVGFRPLSADAVERAWSGPSRTLHKHRLEHLLLLNQLLEGYDALNDLLDAFIHIDSDNVHNVYGWRLEQDHLRAQRRDPNAGMTPDQVVDFVDGYFPGYELYTDGVRRGVLKRRPGCQLRLVVDRKRRVNEVVRI